MILKSQCLLCMQMNYLVIMHGVLKLDNIENKKTDRYIV